MFIVKSGNACWMSANKGGYCDPFTMDVFILPSVNVLRAAARSGDLPYSCPCNDRSMLNSCATCSLSGDTTVIMTHHNIYACHE